VAAAAALDASETAEPRIPPVVDADALALVVVAAAEDAADAEDELLPPTREETFPTREDAAAIELPRARSSMTGLAATIVDRATINTVENAFIATIFL